jgi:hypothetical protein
MKNHEEKMTAFHVHFMEKGWDPVTGAEFKNIVLYWQPASWMET